MLPGCSYEEPPTPTQSTDVLAIASKGRQNFFRGEARKDAFLEQARLREVLRRQWPTLRGRPGVTGMGIALDPDQGKLVFAVLVTPGTDAGPFAPIEGVPVRVLEMPRPVALNGIPSCQPCHNDPQPLPVPMGNTGHTEAVWAPGGCIAPSCTLGFKACDLGTSEVVFTTNAHCATATNSSCAGSAGPGAGFYHRSPQDAQSCTPETNIGAVATERPPVCGAQNLVDATSITSSANLTSISVRDIGIPSAYRGSVVPYDIVQKSGRTTGQTFGMVVLTGATISISDPDYCGCASTDFADQIVIVGDPLGTDWVLGGDSGSAVLDMGSPPAVVGLNFAGVDTSWFGFMGFANTIDNVLSGLNLSLNFLDCAEPCAATLTSQGTRDPSRSLQLVSAFRDRVLAQGARGRRYIATYYRFTRELVGMLSIRPWLLARSALLLDRVSPVIHAVTERGEATVHPSELDAVRALFADVADAAPDPALAAALLELRRDLSDPEVLAEFGVTTVAD